MAVPITMQRMTHSSASVLMALESAISTVQRPSAFISASWMLGFRRFRSRMPRRLPQRTVAILTNTAIILRFSLPAAL